MGENNLPEKTQQAMPEIRIGKRAIGVQHPPVVIAEIGINHGGSLDLAIHMADSAIDAGAEIVKHQTHVIEDEMSEEAKAVIPANADISIYDIMEQCALSEEAELRLMRHVQSRGAIFISTPFSRAAAERLKVLTYRLSKSGRASATTTPSLNTLPAWASPLSLARA